MPTACNTTTFLTRAKERVTLQRPVLSDDGYGGQTQTWSDVLTAWAVVTPVNGREIFQDEQRQSRISHRFLIRYRSEVKDTSVAGAYRLLFDGRTFDVLFVRSLADNLQDYGRAFQELVVEENAGV